MKLKPILFLVITVLIGTGVCAQIITTIAGNGTMGYSGNGGPATSAQLSRPAGVATDNSGNIFIADYDNHVIRMINSAGIISNFAGNGSQGYSGDSGPATSAQLSNPTFLTSNNGNLYFVDQGGAVIRKVNPAGIITSITGNLGLGYSGDGGPLMLAQFGNLSGITIDIAGNMYISDVYYHTVRKINTAGIISRFAGTAAVSGYGGDGGPATSATLDFPYEVVLDQAGNIYFPDASNQRIRKVDPAGIISTWAGNGIAGYSGDGGPASSASFNRPWHITIDNADNIFISDNVNNVIRKVTSAGIISTYAGNGTPGYSGDGGPATAAQLIDIVGIATDNTGNVYTVNRAVYVLRKISCLSASITQQPANVILCNMGNASFSIATSNPAACQWQLNTGTGWNNITDDAIYSGSGSNTLAITGATIAMNNYQYRCLAMNACSNTLSSPARLIVNIPATPAVSINTATPVICAGTDASFFATPSDAGPSPVYQWSKNGVNTGSNSNSYNDNNLNNGDIIRCTLTSAASCVTTATATSNPITITVNQPVTATLSITPSVNNVCYGTPVTFTSSNTNGGAVPQYTWFRNATNLFLNSPTYTDNTLNNGDQVMCVMRSSLGCVTPQLVVSTPFMMSIAASTISTITVSANAPSFCEGSTAGFIATPVNAGTSPAYQWMKNNSAVGTNSTSYTDNTIVSGDIIICVLTPNTSCPASPTVTSNALPMTVFQNPVVTLDPNNQLCAGSSRILDAGNFSSYQWSDGSTGRAVTVTNTGTYGVMVTDQHGCQGTGSTQITTILPLPASFLPADTAICSYGSLLLKARAGYRNYVWNNNATGTFLTVTQPGLYWLEVTDNNDCKGKDTVMVVPKDCIKGFYIPKAFTPNGDGRNDVFKPSLFGNIKQYKFSIYNRWGEIVFQTTQPLNGWNGNFHGTKQDTHTFIWICTYQLEGEPVKTEKGTFALIR